jgi:tRNA(adenine34) deaminase
MDTTELDRAMLRRALELAERAKDIGEVPVGAVLAIGDDIIATAHNERELARDPTAHAEMIALRTGAAVLERWRLSDTTMYVTLEPCAMCAGALVNARVTRLVYGAEDPKAGAVRSLFKIADDPRLNHRIEVTSGVLANECGEILKRFFASKR